MPQLLILDSPAKDAKESGEAKAAGKKAAADARESAEANKVSKKPATAVAAKKDAAEEEKVLELVGMLHKFQDKAQQLLNVHQKWLY